MVGKLSSSLAPQQIVFFFFMGNMGTPNAPLIVPSLSLGIKSTKLHHLRFPLLSHATLKGDGRSRFSASCPSRRV